MIDLDKLEQLARAAQIAELAFDASSNLDSPDYPGYDAADKMADRREEFDEAANPAAILELCAEVRRLQAKVVELEDLQDDYHPGDGP